MTATYQVGVASPTGGLAYGRYLTEGALEHEHAAAALYYAGEVAPRGVPEPALVLRSDLSSALAKRLDIDTKRPLSLDEFANLLNNLTAKGEEIAGRKKHSAHQSVASVFGLDEKKLPSGVEIQNVLDGKRADGTEPRSDKGNHAPLSDERVASAVRQFRAAIGVPARGEVSAESIAKAAVGRIDQREYFRQITATAQPIGFVDITFSPDKSVSMLYALETDPAKRALILADVQASTEDAMRYAETVLGIAYAQVRGERSEERARMAWVGVQHYTSRPAADVVRLDAQGRAYTDTRSVPGEAADVQLHQHRLVLSSMLTESGKIRAVDLDRLDGEVKIIGAVFHASLATRLRNRGADVVLGPHGEARAGHFPDWVRAFHSRRSVQGEKAAREWAAAQGQDWDALDGEQRVALLQAGSAKTRQDKQRRRGDEGLSDIETWQRDTAQAGYQYRSILTGRKPVARSYEQRIELAREASLPLLAEAFKTRAVIPANEVREIAARGLVAAGIGSNPAADIAAVVQTYRERGIEVAGQQTGLVWGVTYDKAGRPRDVVTTGHTLVEETALLSLVRSTAADRSGALTAAQIGRAAERFLEQHPKIDPTGPQWQAQLAMAHQLGGGGRFTLAIGVAGSGKTSSVVAVLVDAWHAEGKTVYGMTVPWRATEPLRDAGVDQAIAIEAFVRRVDSGAIKLDQNSVIVADEVSQIGVRQQLALLRIAAETGARVVEIGDPRQCQSVETPAIELIANGLGDETIPKLLTSIRQASKHGQAVAAMFRDGNAADGIEAMQQAGQFHLVAGGSSAVIARTVATWRQKTDAHSADPDYSLIVMTPTNARALELGQAIRANRRTTGELEAAELVLKAMDPNSKATFELTLSVGDKVRTFTRTFDADTVGKPGMSRKALSTNGDVLEVTALLPDGLRLRNANGDEGRVTWAQFKPWRAARSEPVRLTLGYAVTIDSAQSLTRTEAIVSLPDGSASVTGQKAYTALSRHIEGAELIVSDAAERRQIVSRQRLGAGEVPRQEDVVRNISTNLSRFTWKSQAVDMQRDVDSGEVRMPTAQRIRLAPTLARVATQARELVQRVLEQQHAQQLEQQQQRDQSPDLGR